MRIQDLGAFSCVVNASSLKADFQAFGSACEDLLDSAISIFMDDRNLAGSVKRNADSSWRVGAPGNPHSGMVGVHPEKHR